MGDILDEYGEDNIGNNMDEDGNVDFDGAYDDLMEQAEADGNVEDSQ